MISQIKNKRGSHVGMILSFVIFITFIIFLFTVLSPALNTGEEKKSLLDYMSVKITDNTSTNFTSISISILDNSANVKNCVRLKSFLLELRQTFPVPPALMIAKNGVSNTIENAYYDADQQEDFDAIRIDRTNKDDLFFKIYYSPKFSNLPETSCNPLSNLYSETGYEIGSVQTGNYIFQKDIENLMIYYKENYDDLLEYFNVPPGSEFGFGFTYSNGTKTNVTQEFKAPNIYAKEAPVQYIDYEANVLSGFLNLEVW